MTQSYENSAVKNRAARSEKSVSDPTSRYCGQIGGAGVSAVNSGGFRSVETEATTGRRRDHVQNQNGAHPVVAETLPHLCEEKRRQPPWIPPAPGGIFRSSCFGRHGAVYRGHRLHKLATEVQTIPSHFSLFRCGSLAAIIVAFLRAFASLLVGFSVTDSGRSAGKLQAR